MTDVLARPDIQPVVFVVIELAEGPLRYWTGVSDRRGGPGDPTGLYLGRRLLNVPELVQLADGKAHRTDIILAAADPAILALNNTRKAEVPGAQVTFSFGVMKDGAPDPDAPWPFWRAQYIADSVGPDWTEGEVRMVISAATATASRKRSRSAFWTDADQKQRDPTDRICERISTMNDGVTRNFKSV